MNCSMFRKILSLILYKLSIHNWGDKYMKNYFLVWMHPYTSDGAEWCGIANSYEELLEMNKKQLISEKAEYNQKVLGLELKAFEFIKEEGFVPVQLPSVDDIIRQIGKELVEKHIEAWKALAE